MGHSIYMLFQVHNNNHSLTMYKHGLCKLTSSLMKKRRNKMTMMHATTLKRGA
jgi:hypothetical protein